MLRASPTSRIGIPKMGVQLSVFAAAFVGPDRQTFSAGVLPQLIILPSSEAELAEAARPSSVVAGSAWGRGGPRWSRLKARKLGRIRVA